MGLKTKAAVIAFTTLVVAEGAHALTIGYAGSQCSPFGYSDSAGWSRGRGFYNTSWGTTRSGYCPIPRNNSVSTAGLVNVRVVVNDTNRSANIGCTVFALSDAYETLEFQTRSSSGHGGLQTIQFSSVGDGGEQIFYEMVCAMPTSVAIRRYEVVERDLQTGTSVGGGDGLGMVQIIPFLPASGT
ncbi:MAG: hypothetical protein R3B99_33605 [Polyangiales bacterium]